MLTVLNIQNIKIIATEKLSMNFIYSSYITGRIVNFFIVI